MSLQWDRNFAFEQSGEDEELLGELLDLLCLSSESDLDKIRKAADAGDATAVGEAAHSIKGASANLSANRVSQVALELEKCSKEAKLDQAADLLKQLTEQIQQLEDYVKQTIPSA